VLGKDQYTLFLTGDHGVLEIPAFLASNGVSAKSISEKEKSKKIVTQLNHVLDVEVDNLIEHIDNNQIYLSDHKIDFYGLDKIKVIDEIVKILESFNFIINAFSADYILNTKNLMGYEKLIQNGFHKERSGDIAIILEKNIIFYSVPIKY
jgi:hypothetical protein